MPFVENIKGFSHRLKPFFYLKNIFKMLVPIFLSIPDLVVGIPVARAIFCFACAMPNNLLNEKENPNLPMTIYFIG